MESPVRSLYKKMACYGPGGRNCPCCGPYPSFRKRHDRIVKHREKREALKNVKEEMKPE